MDGNLANVSLSRKSAISNLSNKYKEVLAITFLNCVLPFPVNTCYLCIYCGVFSFV